MSLKSDVYFILTAQLIFALATLQVPSRHVGTVANVLDSMGLENVKMNRVSVHE